MAETVRFDRFALDLAERHRDRQLLDVLLDPRLAADAGRVDEDVVLAGERQRAVDRIGGGAGLVVDQRALLAEQPVAQGRLAGVGLAEQRDPHRARVQLGVAQEALEIVGRLGR